MCPSPSGGGRAELLAALGSDERAMADALGQTAREHALQILASQLQTALEIEEVVLAPTSAGEVASLTGEAYIAAEVELAVVGGPALQSVLFVGQDDANLLFNLTAVEGEDLGGVESTLETRVGEIVDAFLGAVNAELVGLGRNVALSLSSVYLVDASHNPVPKTIAGSGGQLARLSYNLVLPNIMATEIAHVAPVAFLYQLVSDRAAEIAPAASAPAPAPAPPPVARAAKPAPEPVRPEPSYAGLGASRMAPSQSEIDDLLNASLAGFDEPAPQPPARSAPAPRAPMPTVRPAEFGPLDIGGEADSTPNLDLILDVSLRITVELGRTHMNIRDILALGPGSVVELEKLAGEPVDVLVNDRAIAKGEVVVVDENFGVRVTEILAPARRVASLR